MRRILLLLPVAYVAGRLLLFGCLRPIEAVDVLATQPVAAAPTTLAAHRETRPLKVMTYNLNHVSRGNDDDPANDPYFPRGCSELRKLSISLPSLWRDPGRVERNLEAIAGLIAQESPDVVLLQEVDRGAPESLWVDTAQRLADLAGYPYAVWAPKWSMHVGVPYVTGNALLSRYPITSAHNVALNPIDWRHGHRKLFGAHTALQATLDIDGRGLTVINTHLYSKKSDYGKKGEQVRRLLKRVAGSPYPVIIGGDLNASVRRLRSRQPTSQDPTLPLLAASGLLDMAGVHDEATLNHILLRHRDPTAYRQLYSLPPVATDHEIHVAVIDLLPDGDGALAMAP